MPRLQLYARRPENWLEWDATQAARVKCVEEWNAKSASLPHAAKLALLKELLVLMFHTVMPREHSPQIESSVPSTSLFRMRCACSAADRVGIVRKLRWGATLKKDAESAYRLDMTVARFKNRSVRAFGCAPCVPALSPSCGFPVRSRFYGPSVTSVSSMIAPYLDTYVNLVQFDFEDQPYVFCTRDPTRCRSSSDWSSYCKAIFKKWSGVASPCAACSSHSTSRRTPPHRSMRCAGQRCSARATSRGSDRAPTAPRS